MAPSKSSTAPARCRFCAANPGVRAGSILDPRADAQAQSCRSRIPSLRRPKSADAQKPLGVRRCPTNGEQRAIADQLGFRRTVNNLAIVEVGGRAATPQASAGLPGDPVIQAPSAAIAGAGPLKMTNSSSDDTIGWSRWVGADENADLCPGRSPDGPASHSGSGELCAHRRIGPKLRKRPGWHRNGQRRSGSRVRRACRSGIGSHLEIA